MRRRPGNTVSRDLSFLLVLCFVIMVMILLPHINPPAKDGDIVPPGNVVVTITWPPGDTDVDLWVMGPGELAPVGYSNKGGVLFNLLRDDLGAAPDATSQNYENSYSRGVVPGEYIVNVHCFRCDVIPQVVTVEVSINEGKPGKSLVPVQTTQVHLTANGQEKTALRFLINDDNEFVQDSVNNVYRPLLRWHQSGDGANDSWRH